MEQEDESCYTWPIMEKNRINLCICALSVAAYLLIALRGVWVIRRKRRRLEAEGKELPPADRKFVPAVVSSAVLLCLPFLVYFDPFVTAVLAACAVLGLFITLRERAG